MDYSLSIPIVRLKNDRRERQTARISRTMRRQLFILILATLLFAHRAHSAPRGWVQGVIADDVGGPLPQAQVSVERRDGSIVRSTESGGMGFYRIGELPPGDYTLTASHHGYRSESTRISVASGKETTASIQLRTRTTITVSALRIAVSAAAQSAAAARSELDSRLSLSDRVADVRVSRRPEER